MENDIKTDENSDKDSENKKMLATEALVTNIKTEMANGAFGVTVSTSAAAAAVAEGSSATTKDEEQKLTQKYVTLQEKTKNLREMLGLGRSNLAQQAAAVQQTETARRQNDAQAAVCMSKLGAQAPLRQYKERVTTKVNLDKPTTSAAAAAVNVGRRDTDTSSNCSMELPKKMPTMQFDKKQQQPLQKPAKAKPEKKKTRKELETDMYYMQELLRQLTVQNPQIETNLRQLARSKQFKRLELFNTNVFSKQAAALVGCQQAPNMSNNLPNGVQKPRHVSERSERSNSLPQSDKQRHDSEMSNASSLVAGPDAAATTTAVEKKARKRVRTRKNKSSNSKSQESEQEALAKYLNMIVEEFLGADKQPDKIANCCYKPGEDLEAYAQRLAQAGLGRIVEDEVRVNRKNNRQSFITMSTDREGTERDGIIPLPVARLYAFEGDIVRAFVMNGVATVVPEATDKQRPSAEDAIEGGKEHSFCIADDEDPFADNEDSPVESDVEELDATIVAASADGCPKAFVIAIVKPTDKRQVIGTITFKHANKLNDEQTYYKLKPHDMRVPMVYIATESCEAQLTSAQKNDICGFLYVARVVQTDVHGHCIGVLEQPVGRVGNLEAEIKAILLHNGLRNVRPYDQRFNDMFEQPDAPVSAAELQQREDLRKKCIFTIDPLTARDLDDAMSVEKIAEEEDVYEVGVHISDVAHYLAENSELDNIVKERATSIYLVNEVIHMLPQPLCFKCSLLPGEDKFAFSVFWRIRLTGEIIAAPRFTRIIMNSCTQFAYEHAQKIIDNPEEQFDVDDFPTISNGFTPADIAERVLVLDTIAKRMRAKRYDAGALSINNPKLRFNMDPQTGEPLSYEVDGRKDANFLIEEFMLLANQSVARFIHDHFPDHAILRNHAPPLSKSLKALREKLSSLGIEFDGSSSKTIYESMQRICAASRDPEAMDACLSTLLTKPMARAKYFCSEGKSEESDLWHYALSIPIYTHFTSPIRRYPDILVHRLLAASLNYCPRPQREIEELHQLTKICNDQKFNAKSAGDESTLLFFKRYIKSKQSITLRAVVTEVHKHLVNVVTISTGHAIAIHYKMQKVLVDTSNVPNCILIAEKNSKTPPLKLQMFSTVDVKLVIWDNKICGFFVSPDMKQRHLNSIESSKKKHYEPQQNNKAPSNSASGPSTSAAAANGVRKARHNSHGSNDVVEYNNTNKKNSNTKKTPKHKDRLYSLRSDADA